MITTTSTPITEQTIQGYGNYPFLLDEEFIKEIEYFEDDFNKNKTIVKEILETWDPATNDDALLYFEFLRTKFQDIKVTSGPKDILIRIPKRLIINFHITSPESVTRARRKLNELGVGLPTRRAIFIRRMKRQKVLRQYFRDHHKQTGGGW